MTHISSGIMMKIVNDAFDSKEENTYGKNTKENEVNFFGMYVALY